MDDAYCYVLKYGHIFGKKKKNSSAPISSTLFLFWEEKQHEEQSVGRRGMRSVRKNQGHSESRKKEEIIQRQVFYVLDADRNFKVEYPAGTLKAFHLPVLLPLVFKL